MKTPDSVEEIANSRRKTILNFRKHWKWLSNNPERNKEDYFEEFSIGRPEIDCYLCERAAKLQNTGEFTESCEKICAVIWENLNGDRISNCMCRNSLYWAYCNTTNLKDRSKIALKISKLKINKNGR
jgi:hypothetical protein